MTWQRQLQPRGAAALTASRIREHEAGNTELVLDPPDPIVMAHFLDGARRSGLDDLVCENCGRPWLSRRASTLCPVCDPTHVGYEEGGPSDRARWVAHWRGALLGVLRARQAQGEFESFEIARAMTRGLFDPP